MRRSNRISRDRAHTISRRTLKAIRRRRQLVSRRNHPTKGVVANSPAQPKEPAP